MTNKQHAMQTMPPFRFITLKEEMAEDGKFYYLKINVEIEPTWGGKPLKDKGEIPESLKHRLTVDVPPEIDAGSLMELDIFEWYVTEFQLDLPYDLVDVVFVQ